MQQHQRINTQQQQPDERERHSTFRETPHSFHSLRLHPHLVQHSPRLLNPPFLCFRQKRRYGLARRSLEAFRRHRRSLCHPADTASNSPSTSPTTWCTARSCTRDTSGGCRGIAPDSHADTLGVNGLRGGRERRGHETRVSNISPRICSEWQSWGERGAASYLPPWITRQHRSLPRVGTDCSVHNAT